MRLVSIPYPKAMPSKRQRGKQVGNRLHSTIAIRRLDIPVSADQARLDRHRV